jgi:hypothetical protein
MGLLSCPTSFQRLLEGVLRHKNTLIYIDDILVHMGTHEKQLQVVDPALTRLHKNHLKINVEKCIFSNKEVSYLGSTLIPDRMKPGKSKLKASKMQGLLYISSQSSPALITATSSEHT